MQAASGRDLESEFAKMVPYFEVGRLALILTTTLSPNRARRLNTIGRREKSLLLGYEACCEAMRTSSIPSHSYQASKLASWTVSPRPQVAMAGRLYRKLIPAQILSLRTTVAQQSCSAIHELVEKLGTAFDPFVENLMPVLGKMA